MSKESAVTSYREVSGELWREVHKLRGDHEALMQVMIEELPSDERARVLQKYDLRRQRVYEDNLLNLEEKLVKLGGTRDPQNHNNNVPVPPIARKRSVPPTASRAAKAHKKPKRAFLSFVARPKVNQ